MRWQPAIYEHKASLIKQSPIAISKSSKLLSEAILAEYNTYKPDFITVGVDVYNIELESIGAKLGVPSKNECPEIIGTLLNILDIESIDDLPPLPDFLNINELKKSSRFSMLLETAKITRNNIPSSVKLRVAASGPITMAAKMVGMEDLVIALCTEEDSANILLQYTTQLCLGWISCIQNHGFDAIIFDSMSAPPMFSPDMYNQYILPSHQLLMESLKNNGQQERELVIGGDTTLIAASLKQTGANILLCDYIADAKIFKQNIGDNSNISIRRNINPNLLLSKNKNELNDILNKFKNDLEIFDNPIIGTGILPYDFPSKSLKPIMDMVNK